MTLGVSDLQSDSDLDSIRNSCDVCFCVCHFVTPRGGQGSVWESVDEGGDGSGVVGGAGKGHRGEGKQSLREESTSLSHRNCSKSTKDTHSLVPEDYRRENLFAAEELFHHM